MTRLTLPAARRIALAAQGFGRPRPATGVTMRQVQRVIDTLGVIQIDSVNVLARSHYLPFFSRLGPYDIALLDRARDRAPRRLVEYWVHEASLISPSTWPLLDVRMSRARQESWGGMQRVAREHPELVTAVLDQVRHHGPRTARQIDAALAHDAARDRSNWGWNWSLVKLAAEHLFWSGELSSAGRNESFERRYAVPERVLPEHLRSVARDPASRPDHASALVELVELSARALGVATSACLRDYCRLRGAQADPAIETLVRRGVLEPVSVAGWRAPAYLHAAARRPRRVDATALLSPFDSLVWFRPRTEALFAMRYRLEIYTPAERRVHGYYVLPFLLGEHLVARVDLKTDRQAGLLRVRRLTWEPGRGGPADRAALDGELDAISRWLGVAAPAVTPPPGDT